ncbi:hypothetical protein ACH6CV_02320 [Bacillota bacterium Meth-B3]
MKHIEKGVFCRNEKSCLAVRAAYAVFSDGGLCVGVPGSWNSDLLRRHQRCQGTVDHQHFGEGKLYRHGQAGGFDQQGIDHGEAPAKKDDGAWAVIGRWTDSGSGKDGIEIRETMPVERGYSYQVVMTGTVRDAAGKVLDNISEKSSVRRY